MKMPGESIFLGSLGGACDARVGGGEGGRGGGRGGKEKEEKEEDGGERRRKEPIILEAGYGRLENAWGSIFLGSLGGACDAWEEKEAEEGRRRRGRQEGEGRRRRRQQGGEGREEGRGGRREGHGRVENAWGVVEVWAGPVTPGSRPWKS